MKLSDHLDAASDGWDRDAHDRRVEGDAEGAARADTLAAHTKRLASNHRLGVLWDGDAGQDPEQIEVGK